MFQNLLTKIGQNIRKFNERQFYGKFEGLVTSIDDPENLGRIRATVPTVYGTDRHGVLIESDWAWPCFKPGDYELPQPGDAIWIEFQEGNPQRPIWSGIWYMARYENQTEIPHEAKRNRRTKVITTPGGHKFIFDDENGNIKLEHGYGNKVEWNKKGTESKTIRGNQVEVVAGTVTKSISGNDTRSILGFLKRLISGDAVIQVIGKFLLKCLNETKIEVWNNIAGIPNPLLKSRVSSNGQSITVEVPALVGQVQLGKDTDSPFFTGTSLVKPNIFTSFNGHAHPIVSPGVTGTPVSVLPDPSNPGQTIPGAPIVWNELLNATQKTKAM